MEADQNANAGLDIVLVGPEIPWNTGNVGRTCVATQSRLHLVEPLGFSLENKMLKRAGLDYWPYLSLFCYASMEELQSQLLQSRPVYLFSRFAKQSYWQADYRDRPILIFGSETKGLPALIKELYPERMLSIPTPGKVRSLNLSTAVAIAMFEALRQLQIK